MGAYIIRRLIQAVIIIILVSAITFFMLRIMPGDPIMLYMQEIDIQGMTEEEIGQLRVRFGLDKPIAIQYVNWATGVLRGDLGYSNFLNSKVSTVIARKMPVTIHLGVLAFLISAILGPAFGTICAMRRGTWIDTVLTVFANLGICTPAFWFGILMIYLFALKLGWLPIQGYISPFDNFWLSTKLVIMPVICLALAPVAGLTRQTRSTVLETIQQDYVRTAWSKGLSERVVVLRHIIKNAFIPIITMMGLQVAGIFGGSVLIETVFNIPGVGRMLVNAVFSQDYLVVQAGALIAAVIVVLANLAVDIAYGWFDPRIRFQ